MQETSSHDLIVVGTGFASTFFLQRFLERDRTARRVLVLERGAHHPIDWQVENHRNSEIDPASTYTREGDRHKDWYFTVAYGGGSNCWTGCTPRMMPADFELKSRYGVGWDWPWTYDELEPYYLQAEQVMAISGPDDWSLASRSGPYPQPPHHFNDPDRILKRAYPRHYYQQASARPRLDTRNRAACVSSEVCGRCPIDAKFSVLNEMQSVYADERVELVLGAEVRELRTEAGNVSSVVYRQDGVEKEARADLFALGANALFNAAILLRSGDTHPLVGRRIHEQIGTTVVLDLDGVESFQGSTLITGQGFMFYDGEHRRERGACLLENNNSVTDLRKDFGKWRQVTRLRFIVEDLPRDENRVVLDETGHPKIVFEGHSEYGFRGLAAVPSYVEELSRHLPVERVHYRAEFLSRGLPTRTEAHIMGTVVMGDSAEDSVVDRNLVHHRHRNLLVLGSSSFPTGAPANPTLTLSALSLAAAEAIT